MANSAQVPVTASQAHPPREDELVDFPRRWRPNAQLRHFLQIRYPISGYGKNRQLDLAKIVQLLLSRIVCHRLYDPRNVYNALLPPDLEDALGTRLLHFSQLRTYVARQLVTEDSPWLQIPCPPPQPRPHHPVIDFHRIVNVPRGRFLHIRQRPTMVPYNCEIPRDSYFCVTEAFLLVLLDGYPNTDVRVFQFGTICQLLSAFVIKYRDRLHDRRNCKSLWCEGTALEQAFQVSSFHRKDTIILVRQVLRPLNKAYSFRMLPSFSEMISSTAGTGSDELSDAHTHAQEITPEMVAESISRAMRVYTQVSDNRKRRHSEPSSTPSPK